jgi:CHAT domain-containing protein
VQQFVRNLSEIQTPEQLTDWMRNHAVTEEMINEVMVGVRSFLDSGEFQSAMRLSEWCLQLSENVPAVAVRARALVTRGITLARMDQLAESLPFLDAAIALYQSSGDELATAKVWMNRVHCYSTLGRYEEALRDGENSNRVFSELGEKQLLARGLNNLGGVFFRLDRSQEWLDTLEQAAALLQEIGDDKSLAMIYMNQAVALTSLNRSEDAEHCYRLSMNKAEQSGQTWLAACSKYNLGYLHYTRGQYAQALEILSETRKALAADPWYAALCDLTQSEIYLEMNMYAEAFAFAESAHAGFDGAAKPFETAKSLGVMAIAKSEMGVFKEAAQLFGRAKTMFEDQGNSVRAAGMDLHRAVMSLHLRRYADARALAQGAYDAFIEQDLKAKAALARIISARASLALKEHEPASEDAAHAADLHEQSPQPLVGYQLHSLAGEIDRTRGNLNGARQQFHLAIDELERLRTNIAEEELRINYFKDKVPVYDMLVDTDLELGDEASLRDAFETAEKAKSRTLVDLLAGSVESLQQTPSFSVQDVHDALTMDTVLVEYFITGDSVVAFGVSRDRFAVFRNICSIKELNRRLQFIQFHLSRLAQNDAQMKARPAMALANFEDHLRGLYGMLIAPLESFLKGAESVVFVPSGILHYVPFHALFDGSMYLMERFIVSYSPAASIYRLFRERKPAAGGQPVLIGIPDQNAPFIAEEIGSIETVLPKARSFVGPSATRDCLRREVQTAGLIHIATHATFRSDNPMFSSFQLHDGPMTFFDIYTLRTAANLITLSGCGTGLNNILAGDELLGLIRGFVHAGATSVVVSLWDVNDRTTADLMKNFYANLTAGRSRGASLRSAMLEVRKEHPHPFYWAPFVLIGNPTEAI